MTRSVNDNQYKQEEKAKQQENQCPTTLPLMTGMVSVVHIRSLRIAVQLMVVTVAVMVVVLVVVVEVVVGRRRCLFHRSTLHLHPHTCLQL
jgi:hypothetical protein